MTLAARVVLIIFAIIILLICVLFLLLYIMDSQLGPKDDQTLIQSIPAKIGIDDVLYKEADKWDGSCMTIVMQVSQTTSQQIIQEGLSFFDETTKHPRGTGPDNKFAGRILEPWQETPLPKVKPYGEIMLAIQCAETDDGLLRQAALAIHNKGSFYTSYPRTRTHYLLIPDKQLLFSTHFD